MNKTPSILVDTGFPVDQNGILTELDIPNVVQTLSPPAIVNFKGTTLNWIPSTAAALTQITADNVTTLTTDTFKNYAKLEIVSLSSVISIVSPASNSTAFMNCTSLVNITLNSLTTVAAASGTTFGGVFNGCTSLKTLTLPKLSSIVASFSNGGLCQNCTSLESVQLGSIGNPVTSIGAYNFNGCTQAGLTITVYTADGNAIAGSPWGATNATIVWEEA